MTRRDLRDGIESGVEREHRAVGFRRQDASVFYIYLGGLGTSPIGSSGASRIHQNAPQPAAIDGELQGKRASAFDGADENRVASYS